MRGITKDEVFKPNLLDIRLLTGLGVSLFVNVAPAAELGRRGCQLGAARNLGESKVNV